MHDEGTWYIRMNEGEWTRKGEYKNIPGDTTGVGEVEDFFLPEVSTAWEGTPYIKYNRDICNMRKITDGKRSGRHI